MKNFVNVLDKQLAIGLAWVQDRKRLLFNLGLILLAVAAGALLLWSTAEHGIGVRSDSVEYIWGAETLADGVGLGRLSGEGDFKPMIQFPPLYSTFLAIFELVGVGAWEGARWLAVVFFAANIGLIGLAVFRLTGSRFFALAAAGFALLTPAVFEVNLWAMTEAPYVTFVLLGFLAIDDFFRLGQTRLLVYAGVFLGLAFLTRYVGATALGAAGLVLLLRPGKAWLSKLKEGALLAAVAGLPVGLWMGRNLLVAGSATNKILNYHPIGAEKWDVFRSTLSAWVSPLENFFLVGKRKLAALIAIASGAFLYYRLGRNAKTAGPPATLLGWLFLVYVPAYLFIVFFSVIYTGAAIPLDDRMMYPIYTILIVAAFSGVFFLWKRSRAAAPALGLASLILFGLAAYTLAESHAADTWALANESRERGKGYALADLAEREVVLRLAAYPDDYLIYTDNVHQLYYFSGRLAYLFPIAFDTATQQETGEGYALSLKAIQDRIAGGEKVMFVFFFWEDLDTALIAEYFPQMELIVGGEEGFLYVSEGN
jgi:hypothetical protein